MANQNINGHGFEHIFSDRYQQQLPNLRLLDTKQTRTNHANCQSLAPNTAETMRQAADLVVPFLVEQSPIPRNDIRLFSNPDTAGRDGDVRDHILFDGNDVCLADSLKWGSSEQSAPRLGFGKQYRKSPFLIVSGLVHRDRHHDSNAYWSEWRRDQFRRLEHLRRHRTYWNELAEQELDFIKGHAYEALETLLTNACQKDERAFVAHLSRILNGTLHDHWKVTGNDNGLVKLERVFFDPATAPTTILALVRHVTGISLRLGNGQQEWEYHFRLHQAASKIQNSLKISLTLTKSHFQTFDNKESPERLTEVAL